MNTIAEGVGMVLVNVLLDLNYLRNLTKKLASLLSTGNLYVYVIETGRFRLETFLFF